MTTDLYALTVRKLYNLRALICGTSWPFCLPIYVHAVSQAYVLQFKTSSQAEMI